MKISDILRHKQSGPGNAVVTIAPDEAVETLLGRLAEHNIGAVVVVEADGVIGIVSERDIVRALQARGPETLHARVADIMTREVHSCRPDDTIDSVATRMTERRIRHLPVLDGDELVGIVSIGDVVSSRMRELETDRAQLEHYITG